MAESIKFLASWLFDVLRHATFFELIMYTVYTVIGYKLVKFIILEIID
jgi:hypothetical protein